MRDRQLPGQRTGTVHDLDAYMKGVRFGRRWARNAQPLQFLESLLWAYGAAERPRAIPAGTPDFERGVRQALRALPPYRPPGQD
jgi:hypothetical protein